MPSPQRRGLAQEHTQALVFGAQGRAQSEGSQMSGAKGSPGMQSTSCFHSHGRAAP